MLLRLSSLISLLLIAAIFGFFYAYTVSAMWGLDVVTPETAIEAMQGINASVRNGAFFPSFFLPPFALGLTAALAARAKARHAAIAFGLAGLTYALGGIALTMAYNVPLNEALAVLPADTPDAAQIWSNYTVPWQFWNLTRTVFAGVAVALTGWGMLSLPR